MAVFGVDFGNLHSVVSVARKGGIDVIVNEVSKRETASLVSFGDKERYLGEKAADMAIRNWQNTIGSLKRLLGVKLDSEAGCHEKKFVKNQLRADANGFIEVKVNYKFEEKWFKPEELIGMLFTNLRSQAEREAAFDAKVEPGAIKVVDCVVSSPIYYTSFQRKLLQQALQIAGLSPLALINETTAAALDWGIFKTGLLPEEEENSVVTAFVDVGQSATTCSVVSFMKGQLKVIGHVYDRFLGVRDFDYLLFEHFSTEVQTKYHHDVCESKKNTLKFMSALDKMKKVLSANQVGTLTCEMGDYDVNIPQVPRETVEALFTPLIDRLKALLKRALEIPGAERISTVEVIGGGSRIPIVKAAISDAFQKPIQTTLNASESVAKGCGIMGAMLSPKFKVREFGVVDVNVLPVHIGYHSDTTQNPIRDANFPEINKKMVVLRPGDACPKTLNLTFDRAQDFDLFVFYEESRDITVASEELLIGKWKIGGVPTLTVQPPPPVKVKLRINPSMLINVEGASVTEEWETEEPVEPPKLASPKEPTAPALGDQKTATEQPPASPMETDDKADAAPKEEPPKTKKVKHTKKHGCTTTMLRTSGCSAEDVAEMRSRELQMMESDLNVHRTLEAKNNVEAYVYEMRAKVNEGGVYFDFLTAQQRQALLAALTAAEDWLYSHGEDTCKEEYAARLAELKKHGNPAVDRFNERRALPAAVASLKARCSELATQAVNQDGKLAHIPAEELQSVSKKCEEVNKWLDGEVAKNSATPLTQTPTLVAATVQAKQRELEGSATPILSKPKPKEEKPKEDPSKAPPQADGATPAQPGPTAPPEGTGTPAGGTPKPGEKMDLD